jgi:hypothetical protein
MSSMSNAQQGTRGLSSADWTRLKRLKGAANLTTIIGLNTDIGGNPSKPAVANQLQYSPEFHSPRQGGTSRIRRTASSWTDFKAFNSADYVTQVQSSNGGVNTNGKVLTVDKLCTCETPPYQVNKQGLCITCSYARTKVWQV